MPIYKITFQDATPKVNINISTMVSVLGGFNFVLDGTTRQGIWETFQASFSGNTSNIPDFCEWQRNICFSQNAYNQLHLELEKYGEFLPVFVNGDNWFIFNIFHSIKADPSTSSKKSIAGVPSTYVERIGFSPKADDIIFKSDYDGFMGIYCQDDFIHLIGDLTGLEFNTDLRAI